MRTSRISACLFSLAVFASTCGFVSNALSQKPPRTAAPQFTDVAPRLRSDYVTRNDYRDRKYFVQPMCGGVAVFDYDNDGWPDIFLTNGAELPSMRKTAPFNNCLLHNGRNGVFEDRTSPSGLAGAGMGYSLGVAAGDYDNDGFQDLFICNAGENKLLHNNGDGTFSDASAESGLTKPENTLSVAAAWFDYDSDGKPDLIVSDYTRWGPETDLRCADSLKREIYCSPTKYTSVPDRLYRNLGSGKFKDVTVEAGLAQSLGKGMGISIADVNNDGLPDVIVVNDTERNFLFLNQGDGTFREAGVVYGIAFNDDGIAVNGMGSDVKDYNNDGYPDLFYNDLPQQVFALFLNDRGKSFRYMSPSTAIARLSYRYGGWSAGFIDYDNDGWKDIYSANGDVDYFGENARQADTMFRNTNGTLFADVSGLMGAAFVQRGFHRGAAFGDLNNDGSLDIVVTGLNERPRILLNTSTPGNHWLLVELTGTRGNRDALGATVTVTTARGRKLSNHVSISTGFMSSSDRRLHFGLGAEASMQSIEIHWPDRHVQTLRDVRADQILRIRED